MIIVSTAEGTGTTHWRDEGSRVNGEENVKNHAYAPMLALYTTGGCHLCERADALVRECGCRDVPFGGDRR